MKYLTKHDLISLNKAVIRNSSLSEDFGILYPEGLDIVIDTPKQILFGHELYPNVWTKAAFILQKTSKKHIFVNGNKRTALLAASFFLSLNGYHITFDKDSGIKIVLAMTMGEDSEEMMKFAAIWLKNHSTK